MGKAYYAKNAGDRDTYQMLFLPKAIDKQYIKGYNQNGCYKTNVIKREF